MRQGLYLLGIALCTAVSPAAFGVGALTVQDAYDNEEAYVFDARAVAVEEPVVRARAPEMEEYAEMLQRRQHEKCKLYPDHPNRPDLLTMFVVEYKTEQQRLGITTYHEQNAHDFWMSKPRELIEKPGWWEYSFESNRGSYRPEDVRQIEIDGYKGPWLPYMIRRWCEEGNYKTVTDYRPLAS